MLAFRTRLTKGKVRNPVRDAFLEPGRMTMGAGMRFGSSPLYRLGIWFARLGNQVRGPLPDEVEQEADEDE